MNAEIKQLFAEYLLDAKDPVAAAVLTLADTLRREPIIVEPDDKGTVGVKEAAELLHTSSKQVYLMCLAGKLRAPASAAESVSPLTRSSVTRPAGVTRQKPPGRLHCPLLLQATTYHHTTLRSHLSTPHKYGTIRAGDNDNRRNADLHSA